MRNTFLNKRMQRCGNMIILIFLILPNIYFAIVNLDTVNETISYLITSLIYILPYFLILIFLKNKFSLVLISLFFTFSLLEISMITLFDNYISAGNILAIINTNQEEASSFFTNVNKLIFPLIIYIILFVLVLHVYKHRKINLKFSSKLLYLILSLLLFGSFVFYKIHFSYQDKLTYRYFTATRILNRSPYNLVYQLYNVSDYYRIRKLIYESEDFSFNAVRRNDTIPEKEIYILAIGESLRYDNISLNGSYDRETTPLLAKEKNLILFDDYYSTACLTMFSVPQILTRATPQDFELNYKEKSVFLPFKELGFKTYCISWHGNLLAQEKYLTAGVDSLIIVENDKDINGYINKLSQENQKVFFILQFLGSHSYYYNYEPEFERYLPNINNYKEKDKNSDSLYINAYDNTILYTDYIMSEIIHTLKQQNAVSNMIYISDHGENISKTGGGHGGDSKPQKTEYHVPLIVWYSDLYKSYFPEKIEHLKAHKSKKINANNLFYTILDLVNISIQPAFSDDTKVISSSKFQEEKQRYILLPDGKNFLEVK